MLVEKMIVIVESTEADEGDIFIANQWAESLQVGKYIGAASRRNSKVEGCDLTDAEDRDGICLGRMVAWVSLEPLVDSRTTLCR
jgi:hypothetical protein